MMMMMLAWKDRFLNSNNQRQKIVVACLTAWLTITVSLYLFLSSHTAPPPTSIRSTDDITHVLRPTPKNPLKRTAQEKLQAWAKNHPRNKSKSRRPMMMRTQTTRSNQFVNNVMTNPDVAMAIPAQERHRTTAKDKLAAYAKASLQRKTAPQAPAPKGGPGTMAMLLRKAAPVKPPRSHATTHEREPPVTQRQRYEGQQHHHPSGTAVATRDATVDDGIRATSRQHLPFDPFDCPDTPPRDYPLHYSLVDMLREWPVDRLQWPSHNDSNVDEADHPHLYHSLCIFDWNRPEHRERMRRYQVEFDVPFVLRNQPEFLQATERWMQPGYLEQLIGDEPQRNEHSFQSNHLPFWRTKGLRKVPSDWKAPTENVQMSYGEWSQRADAMDQAISDGRDHTQLDHYYFRINAHGPSQNGYLYDELPPFDPTRYRDGENLFMLHPNEERGINCRLGMAGNVAEAHYDYSSNWIVLLGGHRRYILTHPRECQHLALYRPGHPSARHSSVNWSEIDGTTASSAAARALADAAATQVILQASDALYLPTNWLHFIVSLDRNYQCNARSGTRKEYNSFIEKCGFSLS